LIPKRKKKIADLLKKALEESYAETFFEKRNLPKVETLQNESEELPEEIQNIIELFDKDSEEFKSALKLMPKDLLDTFLDQFNATPIALEKGSASKKIEKAHKEIYVEEEIFEELPESDE